MTLAHDRAQQGNAARNWIRFLRGYGPVPCNENMYDEFIRRSARRLRVEPLAFEHPALAGVLEAVTGSAPCSVVLTGTAGDGKTHLCRRVWDALGAEGDAWHAPDPYLRAAVRGTDGVLRTLHVIRDLSAWAPPQGAAWPADREALLQDFSRSVVGAPGENGASTHTGTDVMAAPSDVFLIAANDGQLVEAWHRLAPTSAVRRVRRVLETLLVEDRQQMDGARLLLFNLSRSRSAGLLERALDAFLAHPGWDACRALDAGPGAFYGPGCPIRRNVELLATPLVRRRLAALLGLCDHNRLHVPVRQILLLLANAVLGHPDARERLMTADDVPGLVRAGTTAKASLYHNVFGGNLTEARREGTLVFDALGRFGIGHETSNRVDNLLIFGEADDTLRPDFERYVASDEFYGADPSYRAAQRDYVEHADADEDRSAGFLEMLVRQRRGLFFKIADADAREMRLWELTVFRYAGEYLDRVVGVLAAGGRVERPIVSRLIRGLNRVFTGMLATTDRELLLATGLTAGDGRVSRLLEERISVEPRLGERVEVVARYGLPTLEVALGPDARCALPLYLTRFEFLSRVAEGALPSSFSKECYEDMLAFKVRLLSAVEQRRAASDERRGALAFQLLGLDDGGKASVLDLEVRDV